MSCEFETTTYGKWILAGEHAVIRGHGALVFPIQEKKLTLRYTPEQTELTADYSGDCGEDMQLLFWSVLEQGAQKLSLSLNSLSGHFHLINNIPIGVGMGASAALCVSVARWFDAQGMLDKHWTVQRFAQELEHLFHGKSSGLDIAGCSAPSGIYFQQGDSVTLNQAWHPTWFLSSCGQIGITSHCINQVALFANENPSKAEVIDREMAESVALARQALQETTPNAIDKLARAITLAANCFQQWGLVSENLHQHMTSLQEAGALAVKPTGSGGGGFVVSLWQKSPEGLSGLIPI